MPDAFTPPLRVEVTQEHIADHFIAIGTPHRCPIAAAFNDAMALNPNPPDIVISYSAIFFNTDRDNMEVVDFDDAILQWQMRAVRRIRALYGRKVRDPRPDPSQQHPFTLVLKKNINEYHMVPHKNESSPA